MLNVPELERRWKRYRLSKQMPYIIAGSVSVLVIAGVAFSLLSQSKVIPAVAYQQSKESVTAVDATAEAKTVEQSPVKVLRPEKGPSENAVNEAAGKPASLPSVPADTVQQNTPSAAAPVVQQPETKNTVTLTPSMHFMKDFESDVMDYYFNDVSPTPLTSNQKAPDESRDEQPQKKALPSIVSEPPVVKTPTVKNIPPIEQGGPSPVAEQKQPAKQMLIQRESDMKDIQDVIARFKANKNPALSLFVARRYYDIGNYQQSYNYALITNELDSNIEDSWLIFAKSLYKLDQKDMAIKTLKTYLDESGSVKAKIVLDQMEKGAFE